MAMGSRWGYTPEGLRYSRAFPERGFLYKYLENTKLGRPVVRQLHAGLEDRTTGITGLWQPSAHSDVAF